jgi:small conductance mechanosensitive channel
LTGVPTPALGTVEEVTLRITRIRTADGEVVVTPNGEIVQVTNLSRDWARAVIDVPIPATVDVNHVSAILRQVGLDAFEDEELKPLLLDAPSVMGVESMDVAQFQIRVVARTLPGKQFDVGRALRVRIAAALLREGIVVPTGLDTAEPTSVS